MAARLKKRQSLSVPVRGQLGLRRVHSLSSEPLLGSGAEESQGEPGARRSRDLRRSGDSEPGAKRKQKTRTISVPTGLKEILNELSKELLEEKLEERLRQEEEAKKEEENIRRLEETHKRQIDQVREEFRRKSRVSQKTQRHCESQTGFTTDSDSGFESQCIERGRRAHRTTRSTETGTEEDSIDSPSNEPAVLFSPEVKEPDVIPEEKKQQKTHPLKQEVKEPSKPPKTSHKTVKASAPIKAVKKPPPLRKRLVSVSAPLDKAMEELSLSLGDLDMEPGHDPGLGSSDASREPEPESGRTIGDAQRQQGLNSLLIPTSDFEEEFRSEDSDADESSEQIITLDLHSDSGPSNQVFRVHLLVTRKGVRKLPAETLEAHHANVTRTKVPIIFCPPSKFAEKKAEVEKITDSSAPTVSPDLAAAGFSPVSEPELGGEREDVEQTLARSVSPVNCPCASLSQPRSEHAAEIKRQLTFVETSTKVKTNNNSSQTDDLNSVSNKSSVEKEKEVTVESEVQTEAPAPVTEADTQTEDVTEALPVRDEAGTQTIPVAVSQAGTNTGPSPVTTELIHDPVVAIVPRTPRNEVTFNTTQTSPRKEQQVINMTSQTSPQITSRTRESSPSNVITASQPPVRVGEDAEDEMVCRVLLEHAGAGESDREARSAASTSSSSTVPDDTDRSVSISGGSGRATSYDNIKKNFSRTVNYLDLSRLGNEGETPNSDEIWVTVEDDNKFLTSDTETYSVATDKVSTMATFKGHAVGSGFAENIALLNSASETELAELANESLASDLEGQDFSLANFGNLLHCEMEPIRTRLDSTGRTVSGIAETLYHIQMKSKVLSSFENDSSIFVGEVKGGDEKLELVKDGVPVGEPEHLVEKMMGKLDSALRRRDENIRNVMTSLEEDNKQLRQELELYRKRELGTSEQSCNLESKIQMVLDSMEKLSQKGISYKSPRSDSSKDSTETKPKFKRRSKSRPKDAMPPQDASSSDCGDQKEPVKQLKPKRQSAFENETDSDVQKIKQTEAIVSSTQSENVALKQDLVEQKEKEAQLVRRNLELEAQLVKALTPHEDPASAPTSTRVEQESRECQTSAKAGPRTEAGVNTDQMTMMLESPSSSSPSKSESPVKDGTKLTTVIKANGAGAKNGARKSRARVKVTSKGGQEGEVTEVGEVHGRGAGVDGGTPSPSPSREKEKAVTPPKTETKNTNLNKKQPSRSVSKANGKKATSVPPKPEKKENPGEKSKKKKEEPKKGAGTKNGVTATAKTPADGDTKKKVIEGDDFRVTITSNTDMISCEFNEQEAEPGSPRKKIIVTPKTPDAKKAEVAGAKAEVAKKGGKIPIRETYIKQKAELPAPQQYPAARPSRDQLPHPVPKNFSGSCGASPSFASPLALSLNQPMTVNYVGYNTCIPPSPAGDHLMMASPSDRSLASTNLPFSGRNTVMSSVAGDGSDVFTMMIKQESRDSNVYDAPSYIPDIYTRESPDGAYSYVIDGPAMSSMSNISDLKPDVETESSDGFEKDLIRDFVMMEETTKKYTLDRRKAPFKGYAEKVKQKVIREYVKHESFPIRNNKVDLTEKDRPPTRVLPVRKQARRLLKSRSQSLSVDQLNKMTEPEDKKHPVRMTKSRNTYYSTERLPTLTASEEERIIRLKKYEDDTEKLNEKRAAALRVKEAKEKYRFRKQKSFHNNDHDNEVTIYETNRPWTVPDELTGQDNAEFNGNLEVNANYGDMAENVTNTAGDGEGPLNGIAECTEDDQNNNNRTAEEGSGSLSQKRRKLKKWRGLSPMTKSQNKVAAFNQLPLSVECFIVGRGWQVDQAGLNKAIARLEGINFVRIQMANTINRVVESIRPHNDVVLVHIGTNELSEACHSISNEESVPGLAGSMASVFSRHIITACRTFRETNIVVSVPIPRNTKEDSVKDTLQYYEPLRKAFTNCLRANFIDYDNVIICSNDNLAAENGQPDSKFYTDSVNLSNAGMKKLTKNWESIIQRMRRISEGVIHYRRSSESSSITSASSGGSSSSSGISSIVHRNPWKPY